ncbi:exodeoxyribonuclease V subunit alpha [Opitutales bacterium]|nr:exodeoxyribonuclease V subunit alpha [Opitutales bacterium]
MQISPNDQSLTLITKLYEALRSGRASLNTKDLDENLLPFLESELVGRPILKRPIVLTEQGDLYFRRYYQYELSLAQNLWLKSNLKGPVPSKMALGLIEQHLGSSPDQLDAAIKSISNKIALITGGPGTGKTFMVITMLAALLIDFPDLKICLCAPTGKAAHRLSESIIENLKLLNLSSEQLSAFPKEASTIHRLLRPLPPSIHFRRNEKTQLEFDLLIVDEASMVDLPLMAKLVQALPETSRLLLIGDIDQLAPVEAGTPYHSIANYFSEAGRTDILSSLKINRRFGNDSSIQRLCRGISSGNVEEVDHLLKEPTKEDFEYISDSKILEAKVRLLDGYKDLTNAKTPKEAYEAFSKFQVLCPTHEGELGEFALNKLAFSFYQTENESGSSIYSGLPIIVEKNDYSLGLFNGDIGIILPQSTHNSQLLAWFPDKKNGYRSISPSRLPPHRPAYAITIHRSQGSEYDKVMIVIPSIESEILSRNLLYVASSRAKEKVILLGERSIILKCIQKGTKQSNSLGNRLNEVQTSK